MKRLNGNIDICWGKIFQGLADNIKYLRSWQNLNPPKQPHHWHALLVSDHYTTYKIHLNNLQKLRPWMGSCSFSNKKSSVWHSPVTTDTDFSPFSFCLIYAQFVLCENFGNLVSVCTSLDTANNVNKYNNEWFYRFTTPVYIRSLDSLA